MTKGKNFRLKIKKLPTFENNVCVKIDLRRRKKFPTQDKKKLPTFENKVCVKFDSRQRKKFPTFFLSSHVKFYANVNLKCRHFFILSQTQEANLESRKFFVCLESNWKRKKEKNPDLG